MHNKRTQRKTHLGQRPHPAKDRNKKGLLSHLGDHFVPHGVAGYPASPAAFRRKSKEAARRKAEARRKARKVTAG